ncbi:MAG: hypothetical protein ACE5FH_03055 [Candidatus Zixiibacteriota bacterium]
MADNSKKKQSSKADKSGPLKRVGEDQRFTFIGFDVFPSKPKDLFKSDQEKQKLVDEVRARQAKGEITREQCTLLEERVSLTDRAVMTAACVVIVLSLFIPWYGAYNEIVEEAVAAPANSVMDDSTVVDGDDSLILATGDSVAITESDSTTQIAATIEDAEPSTDQVQAETPEAGHTRVSASEEVIHGYIAKKKIHKEYRHLSGLGTFVSLGSIGSYVFSSGGIIFISAILMLIYSLACLVLPAYTLYGMYGVKGDADQRALALKKILRFNWFPILLFLFAFVLSFLGSEYGFDAEALFTSIGDSYGPGAFLGVLSWGVFTTIGGFILVAAKGSEI